MKNKLLVLLLLYFSLSLTAQQDSLQTIPLQTVDITVTKISSKQKNLPIAVTSVNAVNLQPVAQQLSFQEYLQNVPGLFSLNANNYSQDLRLSIRGFGARAAFGIRGIKLIVDGIPETTPDGQGQIDNLNLAIIKTIEVLRGPSSVLYGNASGGVIKISTLDNLDKDLVKAGYTFGSYDMKQANVLVGLQAKKTTYIFQGNYTQTEGYRDQSGFLNYNFNTKINHQISQDSKLSFNLNYTDSPVAEDSGGLTLDEVNSDRRQARQRNIDFDTKEDVSQLKLGVAYDTNLQPQLSLNTYGFYSYRSFYGKLPFENGGIVGLDRHYFGHGLSLTKTNNWEIEDKKIAVESRIQLGYDTAFQNDSRKRYQNLEGIQGDVTLNQLEQFQTIGVYALDQLRYGKVLLRGGLRYDYNVLKAKDRFFDDGDNSDELQLNAISASINSSYEFNSFYTAYAAISTSFETPALSELSANPDGDAGFNDNLKSQRSTNYEVGLKTQSAHSRFELALFYIRTNDELVPFKVEDFPDRTFFRNAGSSARKGIELSFLQQITPYLQLNTSYTYSNFKYDDYRVPSGNFSDNDLPGIPEYIATAALQYDRKGLTLHLNGQHTGDFFADDANETTIDSYTVLNFKSGYTFTGKRISLSPFFGVNNVLDTSYFDNVRLNAFGNRYYEPAPGINFYFGVNVRL